MTIGYDAVLREVIEMVQSLAEVWESDFDGGVTPESWLGADCGFESLDMVALMVTIEERYRRRDWPYERLLNTANNAPVDDLQVGQIARFLYANGAGSPTNRESRTSESAAD